VLHLRALERDYDSLKAAGEFVQVAKFLLQGKGHRADAADLAEHAGAPRAAIVLKAGVEPQTLSQLADYRLLASGFANALVNHGLFDAALGSMRRVPLATATVGNVSVGAFAGVVEERGVKQVTRLTLENAQLTPQKAAVLVALTNEFLRASPNEAQQLISRELLSGCALAADQKFLAVALSGVTPFTSSGSTAPAFRSDLAGLLASVATDQPSRLFLAMPSLVCKTLAVMGATSTNATPAFPELGPQGGSISQIPVVVSDACATGVVTLLDASRFAGASDPVTIENFRHANVVMDSAPDSPPVASSNVLGLWQANMTGILAERWIGIQRLRTGSVASVSNPNSWQGGFSPP
jgi:HK97 family phage major capsid protein